MADDLLAEFARVRLLIGGGRLDEAEEGVRNFRRATLGRPDLAEARTFLTIGLALLAKSFLGQFQRAISWATTALLDGFRRDTLCLLGDLAEQKGDLVEALNWYEAARAATVRPMRYELHYLTDQIDARLNQILAALGWGEHWARHTIAADPTPPRLAEPWAPLRLMIDYYIDLRPERQEEFHTCLAKNAANRAIKEIHVFGRATDLDRCPSYPKVCPVVRPERSTFASLFAHASHTGPEAVWAIANADIYFDTSLEELRYFDLQERVVALTRWDVTPEGNKHVGAPNSQDAWIFQSPIEIPGSDFHLGLSGCDSHLAYLLWKHGRRPWNPSLDVKALHLHMSENPEQKNWNRNTRVLPPHARVEIATLPKEPT